MGCRGVDGRLNIFRRHGAGVLIVIIAQDVHQQVGRGCRLQSDLAIHDLGFQLPEQIALGLQDGNADAGIILHTLGQLDLHSTLFPLHQIDDHNLTVHGGLQRKFAGIVILVIKGVGFIQCYGEAVTEGVADHSRAVQLCAGGQNIVLQPVDVPVDTHLVGDILVPCHHLHAEGGKDGHGLQVFVQRHEFRCVIALTLAKLHLFVEEFPVCLFSIIIAGKGDAGKGITGLIDAIESPIAVIFIAFINTVAVVGRGNIAFQLSLIIVFQPRAGITIRSHEDIHIKAVFRAHPANRAGQEHFCQLGAIRGKGIDRHECAIPIYKYDPLQLGAIVEAAVTVARDCTGPFAIDGAAADIAYLGRHDDRGNGSLFKGTAADALQCFRQVEIRNGNTTGEGLFTDGFQ